MGDAFSVPFILSWSTRIWEREFNQMVILMFHWLRRYIKRQSSSRFIQPTKTHKLKQIKTFSCLQNIWSNDFLNIVI